MVSGIPAWEEVYEVIQSGTILLVIVKRRDQVQCQGKKGSPTGKTGDNRYTGMGKRTWRETL